jgi:acyl-coenzyme A thioesterase PaaI-like protein
VVGVLSIELKVNFLAPAAGELFLARGQVMRSGRSISVCAGELRQSRLLGQQMAAANTRARLPSSRMVPGHMV